VTAVSLRRALLHRWITASGQARLMRRRRARVSAPRSGIVGFRFPPDHGDGVLVSALQARYRFHHPTLANITQHFRRSPAVPITKSLAGVPQPRYISKRSTAQPKPCPRRAGRVSGMADHERCCGWAGWAGCGIPSTSPQGYHTPARGQSQTTHAPVPSRAAPGLACGRATPGRRDATQLPACKIVGDHVELMIVWTLFGH
jgi:hypothetical protein